MTKTTFAKTLSTCSNPRAVETVGDCCVCLRMSAHETYSNLKEFDDAGRLVPQYTDMLDAVVAHVQKNKRPIRNAALVAHVFAVELRRAIGADAFAEVCRRNAAQPDGRVCHSHDFCDANMVMDEALRSIGIEADVGDVADLALWNAAWDHAKRRMVASVA